MNIDETNNQKKSDGAKENFSQYNKSQKVKTVFHELDRKFEEAGAQRKAAGLQLPYFNLTNFPADPKALEVIPETEAEAAQAFPFFLDGPILKIAVIEPQNSSLIQLIKQLEEKKYTAEIYLVSESAFAEAFKQYKQVIAKPKSEEGVLSIGGTEETMKMPEMSEWERMPITEILNWFTTRAVKMRASDIHLEPEKGKIRLRFRIDGVLIEVTELPVKIYPRIISRVKLMANLKLNIINTPQDGSFSVKFGEKNLDLRVSILPTEFGEAITMRLLGTNEEGMGIEELGFRKQALEIVLRELKKPNGMILTTGPTGSGKTSTLYAFLMQLNKPGIKIITLEDPIEYQLEGIVQTPIHEREGLDFASALRAVLRQDPDMIMVGEIRDQETAETACQAALTGHTVFSTLHTNDASGAIPRLLDLGVKPVTLAPALNALIAQRLVRRLCLNCRISYQPQAKEQERAREILSRIPAKSGIKIPDQINFFQSKGCAECNNLGYRGRVGIFEVFTITEKIEALIFSQASTAEIKKTAIEEGMLTMQQDGLLKATEGITDLAEVWRVTED